MGPYEDDLDQELEEDERLRLEAGEELDREGELEALEDAYPEWSGALRTHLL